MLLALSSALYACKKDPVVTTRTISMFTPAACVAQGGVACFSAQGDFEPGPGCEVEPTGGTIGSLPASTRSVIVDLTSQSQVWEGTSEVATSGDVSVLLWPNGDTCALSGDVGSLDAAGAVSGSRVVLAGKDGPLVVDLSRGAITSLPKTERVRVGGTVTAFGQGVLVTGGPYTDADLYSGVPDEPATAVEVSTARTNAGAAVLVNGDTLLVGGDGLQSMEVISVATRRFAQVASLQVARSHPTVLVLANGEVLVAGGVDGSGKPVSTLEWFTPDATHLVSKQDLPVGASQFVALTGGGALAVANDRVFVIGADRTIVEAQSILPAPTTVALFAGAQGKPVLWTGATWLRWDPWSGMFLPLKVLTRAGPPAGTPMVSPDLGLAMWIDRGKVVGLRFDARDKYAPDPASPYLLDSTSFMAPDRLVASDIAFDPSRGLTLGPNASVFVSDATYADVAIDADLPTGAPPIVVLRDDSGTELAIGGPFCPWPAASSPSTLHVERHGTNIDAKLGASSTTCAVPPGRVAIGVRGLTNTVVRALKVARLDAN